LLKTDHFHFELQPASQIFTGGVENASTSSEPRPLLSLEELVRQTKPAVVYLKSLTKSGTGLFVTDTGVITTNAHLARNEEALLATLPDGTKLEAKIVYVDPELDIALVKTPGSGFAHVALPTPPASAREKVCWPSVQTDAPINPGNSGGATEFT
jgi:S1-C subfamily serine protease